MVIMVLVNKKKEATILKSYEEDFEKVNPVLLSLYLMGINHIN